MSFLMLKILSQQLITINIAQLSKFNENLNLIMFKPKYSYLQAGFFLFFSAVGCLCKRYFLLLLGYFRKCFYKGWNLGLNTLAFS